MKTPEAGDIWLYAWGKRAEAQAYYLLIDTSNIAYEWLVLNLHSGNMISVYIKNPSAAGEWGWRFVC